MKAILRCVVSALALAWLAHGGAAARAQTPLYTANTTTANPQTGVVHFLQIINVAQGPGTYTIYSIVIGANFTKAAAQKVVINFYSGVDVSPNAISALAHATLLSSQIGDDTPPAAGSYTFTYPLTSPFTVTTDDAGSIGVEVILADPDPGDPNGYLFSTSANGRFTTSAPTVGTTSGYVWNDSNLDSAFTGAEQTRFNLVNANVRLALTGIPAPRFKTFARTGTVATMTVDSYTGVNYQLQRTTSLLGNWTNLGGAVAGSNGTVLTFTDNDGTDLAAFYRVVAGP